MTDRPQDQPAPADPWAARPAPPATETTPGTVTTDTSSTGGASSSTGASAPGTAPGQGDEKQWWDNPGMPWRHEPTRADKACMAWIGFMGVFGLAMLPLRGWLLGLSPSVLVAFFGSRSGTAALGALASQGKASHWLLCLLSGVLFSIKFDWIFWWAGKLWGRGMIEVWAGQSPRARKNYERAERWAHKLGWLGMFVAYVPIPLPLMQVIFVLAGSTGMRLRTFLILDVLASAAWLALFFTTGWIVGAPAVALLKYYAKIAGWVGIGLLVFIVGSSMWAQRRRQAA